MVYTITPVEIQQLSAICLGGGACALAFGLAVPSGHVAASIVAFAGMAASVYAYAALTYRIVVVRGSRPEEGDSRPPPMPAPPRPGAASRRTSR